MGMIQDEFKAKRHLYTKLANAVVPLLEKLAEEKGLSIALVESRIKDIESLEQKVSRPEKAGKYVQLCDVTDLCGLRIVLFTNEDCAIMTTAIRSNFIIDEGNSVVKGEDFEDDRFGYLSTHLIAALSPERAKLFEFRDLVNLKMEIQIRTVLQHAWAVLDWKMRYKSEREVPRELRRKLYRVSALLEAADDAFSDLQASVQSLRADYTNEIRQGRFEIPVNRDSLESFLRESPVVQSVLSRCREKKIKIDALKTGAPETAYDYLIRSLTACGISTLSQFERRLREVSEADIEQLAAIAKASQGHFGIFTPLRILMVCRLPPELRLKVVTEVSTGSGKIGEAELKQFSAS